jgi:hypothetical protein
MAWRRSRSPTSRRLSLTKPPAASWVSLTSGLPGGFQSRFNIGERFLSGVTPPKQPPKLQSPQFQ